MKKKKIGRPRIIIGSTEIEKELLSEECLKNWAHLSLKKRAVKIKLKYDFTINKESLRLFYKNNRLAFGSARPDLFPHNKDLRLLEEQRQDFAEKMVNWTYDKNIC